MIDLGSDVFLSVCFFIVDERLSMTYTSPVFLKKLMNMIFINFKYTVIEISPPPFLSQSGMLSIISHVNDSQLFI